MSLRGDKYETTEEVKFRLENTVVLYDGEPVYINRVEDGAELGEVARVFFTKLPLDDRRETRKFLSSRKFDLAPFPMGYMNYNKDAIFVTRSPIRQNRQGLCVHTVRTTTIDGGRADIGFIRMISDQGFTDMVKGVYPSFPDAVDLMEEESYYSVALSRSIALKVDRDLDVLFLKKNNTNCGIALRGEIGIRLSKKYHFLREELEACKIPFIR